MFTANIQEYKMRLTILLFFLAQLLKIASLCHPDFKKRIKAAQARILITTVDNQPARIFCFNKGKFSSSTKKTDPFDAALVWADARIAFQVMTSKDPSASFKAAANGKLKILGMGIYAQWFDETLKTILP